MRENIKGSTYVNSFRYDKIVHTVNLGTVGTVSVQHLVSQNQGEVTKMGEYFISRAKWHKQPIRCNNC